MPAVPLRRDLPLFQRVIYRVPFRYRRIILIFPNVITSRCPSDGLSYNPASSLFSAATVSFTTAPQYHFFYPNGFPILQRHFSTFCSTYVWPGYPR